MLLFKYYTQANKGLFFFKRRALVFRIEPTNDWFIEENKKK